MIGAPDQPRTVQVFGVPLPFYSFDDLAATARSHIAILNEQNSIASSLPVEEVKWDGLAAVAESLAGICRAQEAWISAQAQECAGVNRPVRGSVHSVSVESAPTRSVTGDVS